MKVIELNKGLVTIVDDEDFEGLAQYRWFVSTGGYAIRHQMKSGKVKCITMHRVILGLQSGIQCDHINGNKLDNRRCNLRPSSHSQNQWNKPKYRNNKSGFKGVSFDSATGRYSVFIQKHGTRYFGGRHNTADEAAKAYDELGRRLHGEFFNASIS